MATVLWRCGKSITFCVSAGGGAVVALSACSRRASILHRSACASWSRSVYAARETVTVESFEFTDQVGEATEDGEHFCAIAMRATVLHADSSVHLTDHTPTFIHALPPHPE